MVKKAADKAESGTGEAALNVKFQLLDQVIVDETTPGQVVGIRVVDLELSYEILSAGADGLERYWHGEDRIVPASTSD